MVEGSPCNTQDQDKEKGARRPSASSSQTQAGSSPRGRCLDSQTFHFPAPLSCLALTGTREERAGL